VLPIHHPGQLPNPVCLAFESDEAILIDGQEQVFRYDLSHQTYQGARSMIVVPLKIASQIIGVVLAIDDRPGWFSTADQLLLETLARQAANAIARDFGLELVHSIGNKILGATERDTILEDVVSGAMKLTHTDSGIIYELNKDGTEVVGSFKPEGSVHPRPRLEDPKGITRTVISSRKMMEIVDIEKDGRVNPDLFGRYRSMFAVPLLLGQSVVGVLYLNCKTVRGLTETERSLLDMLAGQAALAIQRTRLYEQIKDSQAMYRSLFEQSPDGIVVHKGGKITMVNPAAVYLFGANSDTDLIGRSILDFVAENWRSRAKKVLEKFERDENVERMVEMCVLDGSGKKVEVGTYTRRVPGRGEMQTVFHDLRRPKTLLREMHHRVKRSLNQVNGFLTRQEYFTKDPEVLFQFAFKMTFW
jgi:PAS domain S-box-containing protein